MDTVCKFRTCCQTLRFLWGDLPRTYEIVYQRRGDYIWSIRAPTLVGWRLKCYANQNLAIVHDNRLEPVGWYAFDYATNQLLKFDMLDTVAWLCVLHPARPISACLMLPTGGIMFLADMRSPGQIYDTTTGVVSDTPYTMLIAFSTPYNASFDATVIQIKTHNSNIWHVYGMFKSTRKERADWIYLQTGAIDSEIARGFVETWKNGDLNTSPASYAQITKSHDTWKRRLKEK